MAFQILLNFFLAFVWMFLQADYSGITFIIGYVLGIGVLFVLRRFFHRRFYINNVIAIIKLFLIFCRELITANIAVLKVVLSPKLHNRPGIFAFETTLEKDWEITILSNLITLTPGTLVLDVSMDNKILYVHAMDIADSEESKREIRDSFEKAIKEVSR
ncbi:Na+/H+ antiporter subunit E [Metabacillus arenae]|uniref:Na+/H+ antiporter subunit E n=1 Tax=Metabacillus arenae TaxID=2771434 RepID=A0A926NFM4_9BACI|nr:Na+/H+ antiporter subunit E [Metabacillus arenae]MBD1382589.1 Na+/H+ antiporter subunit E [Metabacillus arenae]